MAFALNLTHADIAWVIWLWLGIFGLLGLLALLSPHAFNRMARVGGKWIDTSKFFDSMEKPITVDRFVLRHCRLFGLVVMVGAAVFGYKLTPLVPGWENVLWPILGGVATIGALALISPETFSRVSVLGSFWVDTNYWLRKVERPINIDHFVLAHTRLVGVFLLASVGLMGWWL